MRYNAITNVTEFQAAVTLGVTTESQVLEFKGGYAWQGPSKLPEHARELCRDIAQFANTDGGMLLVGVADKEMNGVRVAERVVGVAEVDGFKGWVEDAVRKYLTPSTFRHPIHLVHTTSGVVVAIEVPPHPRLVALSPPGGHGIEYLHRTNHGKAWMNPDEAEAHMGNQLRAIQIEAKRIFDECQEGQVMQVPVLALEVVPPIKRRAHDRTTGTYFLEPDPAAKVTLVSVEERSIHVKVQNAHLNIPYALISGVWKTSEGSPALSLNGRIVRTAEGNNFYLDSP